MHVHSQVNGSSHTVLTPYWAEQLGSERLVTCMCSERSGVLHVQDLPSRNAVYIGGQTCTVMRGQLRVE